MGIVIKKIDDILSGINVKLLIQGAELSVKSIAFDSREVTEGTMFIAVKGVHHDGHQFIEQAIQKGAVAIVCEKLSGNLPPAITVVVVKDSSRVLGQIASAWYDHPSEKLRVIGITGTNGKTTTVFLLHQLYTALGYRAGLLSTIENRIGNHKFKSTHTTADQIQINKNMKLMADAGCAYCFMEVSSHAIVQDRISGVKFYGAVFTNITHDHLDYHQTFSNYIDAKKKFFDELPADAFALTNIDDKNGMVMLQNTRGKISTYGIRSMADFKGKIIESSLEGIELKIGKVELWSRLVGKFNAYNLLVAYAVAVIDRQKPEEVLPVLSALSPVEGRFQLVPNKSGIIAIVDYAHTPDALQNVLETIQNVRTGNEKLITVVGAGGDRDIQKRPVLAQVACRLSDHVILTSDNPRTEDPDVIINDMIGGLDPAMKRKTVKITDRTEAIKTACMISMSGDIVLVAGKGHEAYQEVMGVRHQFDDREVLMNFFNQLETE
nr:UDP-N-acetylmuramoyl-L-alanyl-D-glutamate--2,6-diaminopimelate ligase [Bacteroidota bacterium]